MGAFKLFAKQKQTKKLVTKQNLFLEIIIHFLLISFIVGD